MSQMMSKYVFKLRIRILSLSTKTCCIELNIDNIVKKLSSECRSSIVASCYLPCKQTKEGHLNPTQGCLGQINILMRR